MLQKQYILSQIKKNIKQFNPFEFCDTGGWANFDELDIIVINQTETETGTKVSVSILYACDYSASCSCFSEITKPNSLNKEIFIGNDGLFGLVDCE